MDLFSYIGLDVARLRWEVWVVPIIGVVTAGLTLMAGRSFVRWKWGRRGPKTLVPECHDPFEQGSAYQRRATVRRKGNHVEVLITDQEAVAEPFRGWVVDRSMGGLCLLLNRGMPVGTVLSIRPRQCPSGTPWVRVEVRACKESQGSFEVGCQFQRTPAWSIMLLFG